MDPAPGSSAPTPPTYDAFISYRHADEDRRAATWLHHALETWRTPKALVVAGVPARLRTVFRDEDEMHAGAHLSSQIDAALTASRWLLVICSPRTPGSAWVVHEIQRFRALGRGENILPLLIEGDPATSFPPGLRDEPAGSDADPLAADLRPSPGHGASSLRRLALLRLLAPMLGVRFDDLRRREDERRARRRRITALAGTAAVLVVGGAGYLAVRAEGRAGESQRAEQAARHETDELVRYLTSEVSPGLLGGARVEVLKGYLERIGRHYGDRPAAELSADDQVKRAATLLATALVRADTADLPGALDALRESAHLLETVPGDGPAGLQAARLRVDVLRHTSGMFVVAGRPADALSNARASVAAARALVARPPGDPLAGRQLGLSLSTLGATSLRSAGLAEGRAALEEAVALFAALPRWGDEVRQRGDAVFARRNLAQVLAATGDSDGALREARLAVALTKTSDEDDPEAAGERAESLEVLATLLSSSAGLQEACDTRRAALAVRESAVRADPKSRSRGLAACVCRRQLAEALLGLRGDEEAEAELRRASADLERLLDAGRDDPEVIGEWAVNAALRARGLRLRGQAALALEVSQRALDAVGALRIAGKADRIRRRNEVLLMIEQADVFAALADAAGGRRTLERAVELARGMLEEDPADTSLVPTVVNAQMKLAVALDAAGEPERALVEARAGVASARALLAGAPAEKDRLFLHWFAEDRLGRILAGAGRHAEALDAFRASVVSIQAKLAADGGAGATSSELAIAHMKVGDMLLELGRIDEALLAFRAARDALPPCGDSTRDALLSRRTGSMLERIGRCLGAKRQFSAATAAFEEAVTRHEVAVRGNVGDPRKVEQLRALAADMRQSAHAEELLASGHEPATPGDRLAMAGLLAERGRPEQALLALRAGLAGTVEPGLRRRWSGVAATTCANLARVRAPQDAHVLRAEAMSWLREHVGRTWTEIRRLEAEIATLARDRRTVPEEDLAELKGALHLLQEREPAFDGLRGTAEFTAIFTPP